MSATTTISVFFFKPFNSSTIHITQYYPLQDTYSFFSAWPDLMCWRCKVWPGKCFNIRGVIRCYTNSVIHMAGHMLEKGIRPLKTCVSEQKHPTYVTMALRPSGRVFHNCWSQCFLASGFTLYTWCCGAYVFIMSQTSIAFAVSH